MPNASLKASVLGLVLLAGCTAARPTHYWQTTDGLSLLAIDQKLASESLSPTENIRVTPLGRTESVSHHLVQIRTSELFHLHRNHDLTVVVYRGQGTMRIGEKQFPVTKGDVLLIPRGIPHAFTNRSSQPAVAIAVFTPSYDGRDNHAANATD